MTEHRCFSLNIHEIIGRCNNDASSEWRAPVSMKTCFIRGMTPQMLDVVRGYIVDGVSCANYADEKLILGQGAMVQLKLTQIGYDHNAHISLNKDGVFKINIPPVNIRKKKSKVAV